MHRFTRLAQIFRGEKQALSRRERNRFCGLLLLLLLFLTPALYRRVVVTQEFLRRLDRGNAYIAQGFAMDAEREWRLALRLAPNSPIALQLLGALYIRENRPAEARQMLNRLADSAPNEPHILCRFAALEFYRGGREMRDSARQDALRAAKMEPDCLDAQRVAAEVSFWMGEDEDGLDYLNRALHIQPDDIPLRIYLISHLVRTNKLPKAIELAKEAQAQHPEATAARGVLGSLYRRLPLDAPEHKKAEGELLAALQKNPNDGAFCFEMGRLHLLHSQPKEAMEWLRKACRNGYIGSAAWEGIAEAARQSGSLDAALRADRAAQQRRNRERDLKALDRAILDCPSDVGLRQKRAALYQALIAEARSDGFSH